MNTYITMSVHDENFENEWLILYIVLSCFARNVITSCVQENKLFNNIWIEIFKPDSFHIPVLQILITITLIKFAFFLFFQIQFLLHSHADNLIVTSLLIYINMFAPYSYYWKDYTWSNKHTWEPTLIIIVYKLFLVYIDWEYMYVCIYV